MFLYYVKSVFISGIMGEFYPPPSKRTFPFIILSMQLRDVP